MMAMIEAELDIVEADIGNLYENWFIETCEAWVVPYLGDLLAVQDLDVDQPLTYGQQERRAYVANTLAYRQRKGTTPVLEQLARDITGWGARVVESQPFLSTTQQINHLRSQTQTLNLRRTPDRPSPDRIATPFEQQVSYSADIGQRRGDRSRYNPGSISLYLWRLQSYPIERGIARAIAIDIDRVFTFNPLGLSVSLLNIPQTEVELTTIATEMNLPSLLKREALSSELDQRRSDAQIGLPKDPSGYFGDRPVIEIWAVTGQNQRWIRPEEMMATAIDLNTLPTILDNTPEIQVAIDPETGRLAWLAPEIPDEIRVSYAYGFSGDVGGGPYDRPNAATEGLSIVTDWVLNVDPMVSQSLTQAAQTWNAAAYIWQACTDRIYLPLKRITRTEDGLKLLDVTQVSADRGLEMRPGILKGLIVIAKIGDLEATLLPGTAIDGNGRSMTLTARHRIPLDGHYNTVVLLLSYIQVADWQIHWHIDLVSPEVADRNYDPRLYLRLAQLELDSNSRISQINNGDRRTFAPGIINGLQVSLIDNTNANTNGNTNNKQIEIAKGQAVNREGKLWLLPKQVYSLPSGGLSIWEGPQMQVGQIALLYLAANESGNPQIKITADLETGIIIVPTNQTYSGNLTFHIPSGKTLKLVAIDGDRPHLQGQINVHGLSNSDTSDCGEFHLEGILLEGGLTVLAGNLKRLRVVHSTLFPQGDGLTVNKAELDVEDEDTDDFTLVALLIFAMTLFRRLIRVGFKDHHLTSSQKLDRSSQLTLQQIVNLAQAIRQVWTKCTLPNLSDGPSSDGEWIGSEPSLELLETDNSQLEISVEHCICGTIDLAETIPYLSITNSIIDSVIDAAIDDGTEPITDAIDAPGTHTSVIQSTIIGTTWVRSIDATDSLFTDHLTTLRQQVGCIRFSHVPAGSQTPRRYQCQPDLTINKQIQRPGSPIVALAIAPQQRFAAALGEGVFYFDESNNPIWVPINHGLTTLHVSALLVETPESGSPVTLFAGTKDGHLFKTTLPIEPRLLQAQITSRDLRVMGIHTRFTRDLALKDTITIGDETRTVLDIQSDTELRIDAPFSQDLSQVPITMFWITRVVWRSVAQLSNTEITTLYQIPNTPILIAGTIGAGIWRSIDRGVTWESSSAGLRHLGVRSICHNSIKKLLFAGTSGGGVFYSLNQGQSWLGGDPADLTIQQTGLPDPNITTLATNTVTGGLYAGTQGGGIFRSIDGGQRWSAINEGLTDLNITVLLCQTAAGRGTIASDYNRVMGSDASSVEDFTVDFAVGDWLTIRRGNQVESRRIIEIDRQNPARPSLLVNDAFDPDIPAESEFSLTTLIAIGASGQVFRSNNEGVSWQVISTNRNDSDITCSCLAGPTWLMLGTQVNGILEFRRESLNGLLLDSQSSSIEWRSNNRGLNQVDDRVRVLQRLQPEFTTLTYGEPGYAQLTTTCPRELAQGAENGSEMGVFNDLKNPQRANNLRVSLKEYLRFGLQADLIYIT